MSSERIGFLIIGIVVGCIGIVAAVGLYITLFYSCWLFDESERMMEICCLVYLANVFGIAGLYGLSRASERSES